MRTALLLFYILLAAAQALALNQCGGDKALGFVVGELCESQLRDGCPFGRITCQGANSVACIPNCNITFKQIVSNSLACKNNGVHVCKCPVGYSGRECDLRDACAGVECGAHGVCENGSCACDAEYMGTHCEMRRDCLGSNFVWSGSTCTCAPNYVGPRCERCSPGLLCVPLDKNGKRYGAVQISNETILQEMLSEAPPPEYTARPLRPSPLTLCSCDVISAGAEASFHDDDDFEYYPADRYVHRYYRGYRDQDGCGFYFIGGAVIIGFLLLLLLGVCIMSQSPEPPREKKKKGARRSGSPFGMEK